jgi:hypothetical protein
LLKNTPTMMVHLPPGPGFAAVLRTNHDNIAIDGNVLGPFPPHQQQVAVVQLDQVRRVNMPIAVRIEHAMLETVSPEQVRIHLGREHVRLHRDHRHVMA